MLFKNAGYSRTTTEKTSSTTQFFTVQSRIGSSHPHRFQIWEPRAFHVHKSLKYIEVSFIQHMIHKGRQFSQYNRAIQHVTDAKINSQIWVLVLGVPEVLGVPWGLGDPLHGLPVCMRLIKTISILHIVLNFVHVYSYSVSNLISFRSRVTWGSWEAWRPFRTLCLGDNNGSTLTIHHHINADKKPFISRAATNSW